MGRWELGWEDGDKLSMDGTSVVRLIASGKLFVRAEADGNDEDEDGETDLCLSPYW